MVEVGYYGHAFGHFSNERVSNANLAYIYKTNMICKRETLLEIEFPKWKSKWINYSVQWEKSDSLGLELFKSYKW